MIQPTKITPHICEDYENIKLEVIPKNNQMNFYLKAICLRIFDRKNTQQVDAEVAISNYEINSNKALSISEYEYFKHSDLGLWKILNFKDSSSIVGINFILEKMDK
ncbi:hypothetical protein VKI21_12235 [Cyanobacterium aponinum UTEX 3222]|uniref:hypothetical protein n=1 Tax=Cyanobacterium aponinum TaxID=379064 RepID=UPI003093D891|nr:hypothetical protein VKI21_12235 [Cyanobacterium aponinum UTEX 3222]